MDDIAYRIDAGDRVVWCSPGWDRFALANDGEANLSGRVRNRSLWDSIGDTTTRELYRDVFRRVREGRTIRLPFRCDAPDERRWMEIEMVAGDRGTIELRVLWLRDEERLPEALLHATMARDERELTLCGWCKRMLVDEDEWVEIEKGIDRLGLFGYPTLPAITHGVCPDCLRELVAAIDEQG